MCSVKIKDALQLKNVVVVLDQALYAEAGNTLILYLKWECFIQSALCYLSWENNYKMLAWGTFVLSLERLWRDQFLGLLMDRGTTPPFDSISECMKPSSKCLIAMHAFTGCDTVNAFAGRGKITALQLVKLQKSYEEMFKQLGMEWVLSNELFQSLKQFTCKLYCSQTGSNNINEWRYRLFCKTKFGIFNDLKPAYMTFHCTYMYLT